MRDAPKPAPDWQQIELDYRAGIKTLRQIGGEQGVTEAAIRKRAKREDWTRDLSGRIAAKAEELVRKSAVRKMVRKNDFAYPESLVVKTISQCVAGISETHRALLERSIQVSAQLLELAEGPEMEPEKRARMFRIVTDSMDTVIRLQRQAWGMDPKNGTRLDAQKEGDATGLAQLGAMVRALAQTQRGEIARGTPAAQVVA